jgi:DNA polymerase-1
MSRPDGTPVNAVYGFTRMIAKLVDDSDAEYVAVVFDKARKTFRNDIYPEYKANRDAPPDDLIPQFDLVHEAARAMNIAEVGIVGYEADDLIATYTRLGREQGMNVVIVSSDKDLMQLVGDNVSMFDAMKNRTIGPKEVVDYFGVPPDKVIDVQSLAGDSTDNVPGIMGIGVKTAALLVNEYGDLDSVLERAEEVKQPKRRQSLIEQADAARLSRQLVTLKDDVPVEVDLKTFIKKDPDPDVLVPFLQEQGFKSIITAVESRYGPASEEAKAAGPVKDGAKSSVKKSSSSTASKSQQNTAPKTKQPPAAPVGKDYTLVQKEADLKKWIDQARDKGVVAVDTETTSLDATQAQLVGVSLSVEPGQACYIPLTHVTPQSQGALDLGDGSVGNHKTGDKGPEQIPLKKAIALLKPLLEDPTVLKVGQNIKYDMEVLASHNIAITPIDDTMVLSYVLEGGLHSHGLDELASLHFGHQMIKFKEVAGTGKKQITFDQVPLDQACEYAAEDADITGRLHQLLKPQLATERVTKVYETLDRPLIPVLTAMELEGIKVDAKLLKSLSADFEKRIASFGEEIHKLAGREFNIGSPKQLGEILFDDLGLEGGKKGKTGAYGTGADVLEELVAQGHELPARVLDWRQLSKLKSTYTDSLIGQINPKTGRVHTSYSIAVASTGRLSSNDPNLQNIPIRTEEGRKIRGAFIAEKGNVLLSADYSQIELRLLAHVADIDVLKQAFHDGLDIHALTASQVFGVPVEGMDPMIRRQAKAINFGIIYGISPFGLARQLGISRGDAKNYIDAYFKKYPGIHDYMTRTVDTARKEGHVTTLFGRRCHAGGIQDKNPARRNFAERAAINAPIQGGAADIIKRAMIQLPDALAEKRLKAKMLLQVHDELIFEVPKKEAHATAELVREVMEGAAQLDVPLIVDAGIGPNWDQAH